MNPAILKALIISGGTLGVGVPGMYYAYPHISNLINPVPEEGVQKPSEESGKITSVTEKGGETGGEQSGDTQVKNLPTDSEKNHSPSQKGERASEITDATEHGNLERSGNGEGEISDNVVRKPETSSGGENRAKDNNGHTDGSEESQ